MSLPAHVCYIAVAKSCFVSTEMCEGYAQQTFLELINFMDVWEQIHQNDES